MNHLRAVRILIAILVCILSVRDVRAQHTETRVENAQVIYVEGNDVVLKLPNGEVKQFEVSDDSKFTFDGKDVTVHELKPGMKLTATIATANPPRWVEAVKVMEMGTVWKSVGSNLIIRTPEGENKMYRVPSGGKVIIEGQEKMVDQLRVGDKITATVVKTTSPAGTGNQAAVVHKALRTPARVGVLLIDEGTRPAEPAEPPGMWGTTPIIILILLVLLVAAIVLWAFRRKRKV